MGGSITAGFLLVVTTLIATQADDAQDESAQRRTQTKAVAVGLWTALAILSVFCLGVGLIWGVSRAARRFLKRREPIHTDMPDIWFLNPPEKRKPDKP
jgi:hypothetical protein